MRPRDDGAVAVELAMIVGLLLMIALGAVEYGLAFNNYFGLAASSREGARVGASIGEGASSGLGSSYDADCRILEAAAAALHSTNNAEVVSVTIREWDAASNQPENPGFYSQYRPFISGDETDNPQLLRCNDGWFELSHGWPESVREPAIGPLPWIAVDVEFEHHWTTNFLWWNGSVTWNSQNVLRVEPVNYG